MAATVTVSSFSVGIEEAPNVSANIAITTGDKWVVALIHLSEGSFSVSTATFGGSTMASMGTPGPVGGDSSISGYRFDASGIAAATYTLLATFTGAPDDSILGYWVTAGSDQPTNWMSTTDTGSTVNITVNSAADGIAIWGVGQDYDSTLTPAGGETEVYDGQASATPWYYASGFHKPTTGSTTQSNITGDSGTWYGVGLFVPSAGGAAAPSLQPFTIGDLSGIGSPGRFLKDQLQ